MLGATLAVVLGFVLLGVFAEIGLRVLMPQWRDFYSGRFMATVAVPGYGMLSSGRPGFDGHFAQNNSDFRAHIRLNALGLRDEAAPREADGRAWIIGDSMTFGWGVERNEMYSTVAGALSGRPTYNVASPGTDICGYQALVARMPDGVRPAAAVVGLVLENDLALYRCPRGQGPARPEDSQAAAPSLTGFKRFLTEHLALYNVVAVSLKRVPAVVGTLERLGIVAVPQASRPHAAPEMLPRIVASTSDELLFLRRMLPADARFAVLIMPARFEIRDGDPYFAAARQEMAAALRQRGIAVIDPFDAFRAAGFGPTHFAHDGHWSPLGHRIAGEAVASWLRAEEPPAKR